MDAFVDATVLEQECARMGSGANGGCLACFSAQNGKCKFCAPTALSHQPFCSTTCQGHPEVLTCPSGDDGGELVGLLKVVFAMIAAVCCCQIGINMVRYDQALKIGPYVFGTAAAKEEEREQKEERERRIAAILSKGGSGGQPEELRKHDKHLKHHARP